MQCVIAGEYCLSEDDCINAMLSDDLLIVLFQHGGLKLHDIIVTSLVSR
jgi:hypothetical protein